MRKRGRERKPDKRAKRPAEGAEKSRRYVELSDMILRAKSWKELEAVKAEIKRALESGAILKRHYDTLMRTVQAMHKKLEFARELSETSEAIKKGLAKTPLSAIRERLIKRFKVRKVDEKVFERMYWEYLKEIGIEVLFEAFKRRANAVLKSEGLKIMPHEKKALFMKRFSLESFHRRLLEAIESFGAENIASLAIMLKNCERRFGAKILGFSPHKTHLELRIALPVGKKTIRDVLAIEEMRNGEITKVGSITRYHISKEDLDRFFDSGKWFDEEGRKDFMHKRREFIKNILNRARF